MNKAISQGFGMVLNIAHAFMILIVLMIATLGKSPYIAIGTGIGYIFMVGISCTLIAIREHLETLIAQRSPPVLTVPAPKAPEVMRRREGFVNV